jgi:hypothetical protein
MQVQIADANGGRGAERGEGLIRKTVSLDPFIEGMIRRHEAVLLNKGWRSANFSLSLSMIVLAMFFDHAANGETLHRETVTRVNQWLAGRLHLSEKDLEKWTKWVEKVASQPEADPPFLTRSRSSARESSPVERSRAA